MREQGTVIGVGIGRWEMCRDFVRDCDLDCILLANRYTLLEQGGALHEHLPLCLDTHGREVARKVPIPIREAQTHPSK